MDPPFDPGSPSDSIRILEPLSIPAGIGIFIRLFTDSVPFPTQCLQGDATVRPIPLHVEQVVIC